MIQSTRTESTAAPINAKVEEDFSPVLGRFESLLATRTGLIDGSDLVGSESVFSCSDL